MSPEYAVCAVVALAIALAYRGFSRWLDQRQGELLVANTRMIDLGTQIAQLKIDIDRHDESHVIANGWIAGARDSIAVHGTQISGINTRMQDLARVGDRFDNLLSSFEATRHELTLFKDTTEKAIKILHGNIETAEQNMKTHVAAAATAGAASGSRMHMPRFQP